MKLQSAEHPAPAVAPPRPERRRWRSGGWVESIVVVAAATAIAVLATWPLVMHLGSSVHDIADPLHTSWLVDWVQYALVHLRNPYDTNAFAPQTLTLVYSDTLLGSAVVLYPFRWLGLSPAGVNNAGVIFGGGLSAAAAYGFGRTVTGSRTVGAVTGAAYSFGPFGTSQGGNLQTVMRPGIPLAATAAWVLAERAADRRRAWPWAVLLVGAVAWQSSSSVYLGVYALIVAGVVALCRIGALRRGRWRTTAVALGSSALALALFLLPYLIVKRRIPGIGEFNVPFGIDFARTDPRLSIWGSLLGQGNGWPVVGLNVPGFPGLTLILLGLVGLVALVMARRHDGARRRTLVVGVVLTVVGLVMALAFKHHGIGAYLPYRLIFEFVPGFRALRSAGRAWLIGLLGVGLLAGEAVRWIGVVISRHTRAARWRSVAGPAIATIAVAAIVAEGYAPWTGLHHVAIPAVDRELARRPGPGGVLYLPINTSLDAPGSALVWFTQPGDLYATTAHHRFTPNGYAGFPPPSYYRTGRLMRELPGPAALSYLRSIGIRYVVLRGSAGPWSYLADPRRAAPLRSLGRFGPDVLLEVPGAR